jgi:hypothetical protein
MVLVCWKPDDVGVPHDFIPWLDLLGMAGGWMKKISLIWDSLQLHVLDKHQTPDGGSE